MKVCCDTEGRELTDERRYAPTSVPLRRKPCSRSPETLFHFTGIPTVLVYLLYGAVAAAISPRLPFVPPCSTRASTRRNRLVPPRSRERGALLYLAGDPALLVGPSERVRGTCCPNMQALACWGHRRPCGVAPRNLQVVVCRQGSSPRARGSRE